MMSVSEVRALRGLLERVESEYGLTFADAQLPVIARKLAPVLVRLGAGSMAEAVRTLAREPGQMLSHVIPLLTVGETRFFRNPAQFDALHQRILPGLRERLPPHTPIVIWSAGCATGEEPYSLAMWLRRHAPELYPDRLRIVATDINPASIEVARAGRYRAPSLRQLERSCRAQWFRPEGDSFVIDPSLRGALSFQVHNLVSGTLPAGLSPGQTGIVFCRNVLIYFGTQTSNRVLALLQWALMPEGRLVTGHAESAPDLKHWSPAYQAGTLYYLKPGATPATTDTLLPSAAITRSGKSLAGPRGGSTARPTPRTPTRTPRYRTPFDRPEPPAPPASISNVEPAELLVRARTAADGNDLDAAHRMLQGVLDRDPLSLEGHFLHALVAERCGDRVTAREALRRALFLDKRLVMGHYFLGMLCERDGDAAAALRSYRTVCRLLTPARKDVDLRFGDGVDRECLHKLARTRAGELESAV